MPRRRHAPASTPPGPSKLTPGQDGLSGDSCVTADFCVAVASVELNGDGADVMGVEVWNGKTWMFQKTPQQVAPNADAGGAELAGVSCTAVTSCTAVGDFYENNFAEDVPLAEFWNGTAWTVSLPPTPAGITEAVLVGVSCSSADACTAVGHSLDSADLGRPFAESWNGSKWSIQDAPTDPGSLWSYLYGVSCMTASECTAAGYAAEATDVPLIETWNGKAWSIDAVPNPSGGGDSALVGISCASASACTAVGGDDFLNDVDRTLIEVWNGRAWAVEKSPNVKGVLETGFTGVSCSTPTSCTAVGYSEKRRGASTMFVASSNGGIWTPQTTQAAGAGDTTFNAVSCVAPSVCQAVGYVFTGTTIPLAEGEGG